MAPFEALYGQKCRTPLNWVEPGERRYYGIDFIKKKLKNKWVLSNNTLKQFKPDKRVMLIKEEDH